LGPIETGRTELDDEKLIHLVVHDLTTPGDEPGAFANGQFAEKNAVLNMLAVILEQLEQTVPPLVLRDVVGAEVAVARGA
jgi:hypothetical protein